MHTMAARTEHRIRRFIDERLFPQIYRDRVPLEVAVWAAPDEPVPFAEASDQNYEAFEVGSRWGKPWGTTWFRVRGEVPADWHTTDNCRVELDIDLGFTKTMPGFQAEATAWTPEGRIIKGIEPFNSWVPVEGEQVHVLVEAASNPNVSEQGWIVPTPMGDKATAGDGPLYTLMCADVALLDEQVYELAQDVVVLTELMMELPESSTRRLQILAALERMLNTVNPFDLASTAQQGREVLAPVLEKPAHMTAHEVYATGHAHIDSAWLWPTRETRRKCARTFSNVLALMDRDPDAVFACSSAQQYQWMKEDYPELFERIRDRVAEGRFVPVGGMWVESDTNMPGGEAMVRQFVEGTNFFIDEFGFEPNNVWLPDSFGYSAALPQLARLAGKKHFLTQKISWNDTNKFPHHTFEWEGIDGTRVFTHFPPVDTYNAEIRGAELAKSERQYLDKAHSTKALMPFGYGDGGGGPTREMMARARRTSNLEGSPKVKVVSPEVFFADSQAEYTNPPVWRGELYLEYHRGTYTSQHETKRGNRECEHLLREAELWWSTAVVRTGAEYPRDELQQIWRLVLLQQFHDILPGSSIAWVHREAESNYESLRDRLRNLIERAIGVLVGDSQESEGSRGLLAFNASPFEQCGIAPLSAGVPDERASAGFDASGRLETAGLSVQVDLGSGRITSLVDRRAGRELATPAEPMGQVVAHQDIPNEWDAWDINHFYKDVRTPLEAESVEVRDGEVVVTYRLPHSTIRQVLRADELGLRVVFDIDWHERQTLIKWYLPVAVKADTCASEIQFGHLRRPTHVNTSWDAARFETIAHRWLQVGDTRSGLWLANSSTYGYDVSAQGTSADEPVTRVGASLVRAPLFPDPEADQGQHHLEFVIGAGTIEDAIPGGYAVNLPLRIASGSGTVDALVGVDNPAVVIEAVKLAEDGSGDVVVRLYESLGAPAAAAVSAEFETSGATRVDLLERKLGGVDLGRVELHPFEVVSIRLKR
ncbi:alpha-mannosidase [Luteococcus peritonei]|uniref:Alpha-mannosidase n=1 Tax=Luteococcus peritonei TaxID=88874 RepID=A0ABW4RW63_9ACTN